MMRETLRRISLTAEELDIVNHAEAQGLHVKKAGPHSGHCWYCFDCQTCEANARRQQNEQYGGVAADNVVESHHCFDSNKAIKYHLEHKHGVHWY